MEYSVLVLHTAKQDLEKLDRSWRIRILERIEWLAKNAEQVSHHRLQGMPEDLAKLCRFRVGDYRILYWKKDSPPLLEIFRVTHRSEAYK